MFKTCPDPIDVQDLQFKLHCRLKVFNNKEIETFPKSHSLISCASRYGLLFIGSNASNLQAIQLKCVENYTPQDKEVSNYPRRNVPLPSAPQHISVNCDSTILAVVTEKDKCAVVAFYDVLSFFKQNISVIKEARLSSTPGIYIREINWNPALPSMFTACKSDGTLGVYEVNGSSININELPAASDATCFCWSPKGKQIAVGSKNGRITQYKPDLKAVKVINQPPLEGSHSLISLQWVSNYQFIGIYQSAQSEGTAKLIVVDAPKTGDPVYTNYEDVCYSGITRIPQFYMILLQHWNILMVASSNSTELGVLGSAGETWTQWIISDSARAELPLSADHQETLPVGLALDISSTRPLPWNESSIPPCPYLLIMSHQGVLCFFSVINLKPGIPSICTPPDNVTDLSGIQQFVTSSDNATSEPSKTNILAISSTNPPASQVPVFGTKVLPQPQPTYTAPAPLFGGKKAEGTPLFGGQATLTPIKPSAQPLFGGQTFITPINKQQQPAPTGTEKYSSLFSALNTPTTVIPAVESKTVVISTQNIPKPVGQLPVGQQKVSTTPTKPPEPTKTVSNLKLKEETDGLLAQMLKDECLSLEAELNALLHQGRLVDVNVGSDAEKVELIMKIDSLQEFIKEIIDISIGENAEVHCLKQNLIQSWAWFEEARSRYNASKDETVSLLLKSQPLDSATEKKQADIRKMMYYIESQITQASRALDEQWDKFQDYAKKVHRTKMPTMEAIFQAMVRQNGILQKQTYILKDIGSRVKGTGRGTTHSSLLLSVENNHDLEDRLNRLKIEHPQDVHQLQYERVLNRTKILSKSKTNKLRNLLKSREVLHIPPVKPQLSSSLMLQSPESKSRRLLSNLAALGTSPLSVIEPIPKALSFVHSTPIREQKSNIKPTDAPPNTPMMDAKVFTFKKIEKAAPLSTTTNSFIPVSKSTFITSSLPQGGPAQASLPTHMNSAFVPTGQVVNFSSGGKLFDFSSTATSTTSTAVKTPSAVDKTSTFSFGDAGSTLPKFGTSTATSQTPANSIKPNFGSGLSITPVTTTNVTQFVPTTKTSFSFGGSNLIPSKITTDSSSAAVFGNLPQTSTIGNIPTMSTFSAFSAVTTSASLAVPGTKTDTSKPFEFTNISSVTSTASNQSLSLVTTNKSEPATSTTSIFSTFKMISKPLFQSVGFTSTSIASSTPSSIASTSSKQPFDFGGLATSSNTSSAVSTAPVTTTTQLKMSSSLGTGDFAQNLVLKESQSTTSIVSTTSVPSSTTPSSTLSTPTGSSQSSIFASQPPTFGTTISQQQSTTQISSNSGSTDLSVSSLLSIPSTTLTSQPSISGQAQTVSSNKALAGQQSIFGATSTSVQSSVFGGSQSTVSGTTTIATTAQTSSVFGTTSATVQPSIFGATHITTSGTTATIQATSIFGSASASSQPSFFGTSQNTTSANITTVPSTSIFTSTATTTSASIFGATQSTTTTTTQSSSIFGTTATATQSTTLGSTTPSQTISIFGTTITPVQPSIFGAAQSSSSGTIIETTSTQPSIFSSTSISKTTTSSIFGGSSATTAPSIFGVSTSSTTTKPSAFSATPGSNQSSLFSTNTTTNTTQGSVFGNTSSASIFGSSSGSSSIFGGAKPVVTTKSSIFGGGSQTTTTQNSIFGASAAPVTQASVFGAPTTTAASPFAQPFGASSPFGQSASVFGTAKTSESAFGGGFGSPAGFGTTTSTTASIFGQPASFGSTSASVFGTPTTAANVFGSSTSTFGANTAANVFGSSAPASTSSSFSFAGAAINTTNTGSFGFGSLNVGAASTTSNVFGGSATFGQSTAANPFGRTTEQKSPFGGGNTSIFGTPASSSGSIFGSNTGSNTQSAFGTSGFGSPSTFGQQSTFGQSTFGNNTFGTQQPGPFSGGGGAVTQTGFGSPPAFAKPSGFGSPPVFGGSPQPAFGATPSFGGAPAFGAAPSFNSPNKIFGSNTPTAGFGAATNTSTGFGNLANQNTVGFGNLAQQAATPNNTPFSGSSSFSSWR